MSTQPYTIHHRHQVPRTAADRRPQAAAGNKDQWFNQTLCEVNDSVVRLGVLQGEFHWHKQLTHDDEFFYVVEGRFVIDLEGARSSSRPSRDSPFERRSAPNAGSRYARLC